MVKEAESHASEDRTRRELIDARNGADALAYQVEKTIKESRDKLPADRLSPVESAVAQVREAVQGDDLSAIQRAKDDLQRLSHGLAEDLYRNQGSQGSQRSGSQGSQSSDVKDGEVVDAEYAETRQ